MNPNRNDVDDLIEALREDLPSQADQVRIRKRLVSVGLFTVASSATLGAHAAGLEAQGQAIWSVTPKTTLIGKLLGLSGTTKATLVTIALGGGALGLPVMLEASEETPDSTRAVSSSSAQLEVVSPVRAPMTPQSAAKPGAPLSASALEPPRPDKAHQPPRSNGGEKKRETSTPARVHRSTPLSDLADETQLMESAIAAHQRGDRTTALRSLTLHAERYPGGALAPERERLRARLSEGAGP